jgi:hypothetical protein
MATHEAGPLERPEARDIGHQAIRGTLIDALYLLA